MVVGAYAVMAHGTPRTSADLDVVIHLPFAQRADALRALEPVGLTDLEERKDEFGQRVVGTLPSSLELELFFTPPIAPYADEYRRRVEIEFRGARLPFISPEDLVLRKLVNTKLRRGLDYQDAVGVLAVQGHAIDLNYLRARCGLYRVCDLLDRALAEAKAAQPEG